jgi:hypothetical protein
VSKLHKQMETSRFLRSLAEAIRRYRGPEDDAAIAPGDLPEAPPPEEEPDRLSVRLRRLTRRR